jgi:hypothetical protein
VVGVTLVPGVTLVAAVSTGAASVERSIAIMLDNGRPIGVALGSARDSCTPAAGKATVWTADGFAVTARGGTCTHGDALRDSFVSEVKGIPGVGGVTLLRSSPVRLNGSVGGGGRSGSRRRRRRSERRQRRR